MAQKKILTLFLLTIILVGLISVPMIASQSDDSGFSLFDFIKKIFSGFTGKAIDCNPLIDQGLVSYWTFDSSSNPFVDDYGNNDGSGNGNVAWTSSGQVNGAVNFDGTDDYIYVQDSSDFTLTNNNFAISVWLKFNSFNGAGNMDYIFGKFEDTNGRRGWILECSNNGDRINFRYSTDGTNEYAGNIYASGLGMQTGVWYHVVISRVSSTDTRVYLNGQQVGTTFTSGYTIYNPTETGITIGDRQGGSTQEFDGVMDELALYKGYGLTAAQVQEDYENGLEGYDYCVTPSINLCGSTITEDLTLDSDVTCSGTAITAGADNLVIDCQGHSINGDGTGYGIYASGKSNITVKNCVVEDFSTAVRLQSGNYNKILDSTLINSHYATVLTAGDYLEISGNVLSGTGEAIYTSDIDNSLFANNDISGPYGIYFRGGSANNELHHNTFDCTTYSVGFYTTVESGNDFWHNEFYGKGFSDWMIYDGDAQYCNGVGNYYGADVPGAQVHPEDCGPTPSSNTVNLDPTLSSSSWTWNGGIPTYRTLQEAFSNVVKDGTINFVSGKGPALAGGDNVKDGTTLNCNGETIHGDGSGFGIYIYDDDNVTVNDCVVDNFQSAVRIQVGDNNKVLDSDLTGSSYALVLTDTLYNKIDGNTMRASNPLYLGGADYNVFNDNTFNATGSYAIHHASASTWNNFTNNIVEGKTYSVRYNVAGGNNWYWLNDFYTTGFNTWASTDVFCVNGVGNEYKNNVPALQIPPTDCGGIAAGQDDDGDGYCDCPLCPANGYGCLYEEEDCDDSNINVNPGADEVCDNFIDDDCNGLIDEDDPACQPLSLLISEDLVPNPVNVSDSVSVSGTLQFSDGSVVANNPISIFMNGVLFNETSAGGGGGSGELVDLVSTQLSYGTINAGNVFSTFSAAGMTDGSKYSGYATYLSPWGADGPYIDIDLGQSMFVDNVSLFCRQYAGNAYHFVEQADVEYSTDGVTWLIGGSGSSGLTSVQDSNLDHCDLEVSVGNQARYLRVIIQNPTLSTAGEMTEVEVYASLDIPAPEGTPAYYTTNTDSNGDYSYTFTAPASSGIYTIKANASALGYDAEATELLDVRSLIQAGLDADGDGYCECPSCPPAFYCLYDGDDCDDSNINVNPGADEICYNEIDDNCDGNIDEGCEPLCYNAVTLTSGYSDSNVVCSGTSCVVQRDIKFCDGQNGFTAGQDNIHLDCKGYKINGTNSSNGYAFQSNIKGGIQVRNCEITNFNTAIRITNSKGNSVIENNKIYNMGDRVGVGNGIYLHSDATVIPTNNIIRNNNVSAVGSYPVYDGYGTNDLIEYNFVNGVGNNRNVFLTSTVIFRYNNFVNEVAEIYGTGSQIYDNKWGRNLFYK